jgi:hypothetical protein
MNITKKKKISLSYKSTIKHGLVILIKKIFPIGQYESFVYIANEDNA